MRTAQSAMGQFASKVVFGGEEGEELQTSNPLEDLVIDVELSKDATLPDYATTGAPSMSLYPKQSVQLDPGVPTLIETGVKLELPYMLAAQVTGPRELAERRILIHTEFLGCVSRETIQVLATLTAGGDPIHLLPTDVIGHLTILPVARPELRQSGEAL